MLVSLLCLLLGIRTAIAQPEYTNLRRQISETAAKVNVTDFVNGTTVYITDCQRVNCTVFDRYPDDASPSRLAKRRLLDTSFNRNVQGRGLRALYIREVNVWYVRAQSTWATGRQILSRIRGVPGVQVQPLADERPIDAQDTWLVTWLLPPWILRQFGVNNADRYEGLLDQGQPSLEEMLEPGSEIVVDPLLREILNAAGNLAGGDARLIRLRAVGMAAEYTDDMQRAYFREQVNGRTVNMLFGMESDEEARYNRVVMQVGQRLQQMYPDIPGLWRDFRMYAAWIRDNYMDHLLQTQYVDDQTAPIPDPDRPRDPDTDPGTAARLNVAGTSGGSRVGRRVITERSF